MKILVTGFDPFGGETVNPAYEAVKLLPNTIAGAQIIKLQVPTRFALSGAVLEAAVNEHICAAQFATTANVNFMAAKANAA